MKTLIELFDESPILNVLASVAFKPEKLIFFGADPLQVEESRRDYVRFFKSRGENPEIEYISADMENIDEVNGTLAKIIAENPDCVVDVTGGKDIALLAAGMAAVRLGVPLIAYNKRTKRYANICQRRKRYGKRGFQRTQRRLRCFLVKGSRHLEHLS